MLKLKDVPEENVGEVIRSAANMQMKEEAEAQQKSATVAAAEEMGISEEYLERATQQVHAQRVAEIQKRRRRNGILGAVAAVVGATAGIAYLMRPPAPLTVDLSQPTAVTARISEGTEAAVQAVNGGAAITVNKFGPNAQGTYFANAQLTGPTSLSGYRNMSFTVSGDGGLKNIRIDLENGNERWKGPVVSVSSSQPQTYNLSLDQFHRQAERGGQWRNGGNARPGDIKQITVKTGDTINTPDSVGTVEVRDVTFK